MQVEILEMFALLKCIQCVFVRQTYFVRERSGVDPEWDRGV